MENATDPTLDAFAVDGRWLRSINLPAGRHELSTTDWGVRGLVIAQFSAWMPRVKRIAHPTFLGALTYCINEAPRLVIWLVCAGITASAQGQLVINELVASNSLLADDPDFAQSSDVVELHNAGAEALDLSGWHLTDNFNDTTKWTFPDGVTIGAGGFLLVWCDGENAEASQLHSSFKLSSIGEELAVYDASGTWVDGVVFPTQSADISYGRATDAAAEGLGSRPDPRNQPLGHTWVSPTASVLLVGGLRRC